MFNANYTKMIESGDKIKVKDNLYEELNRLGKIKGDVTNFVNRWIGKVVNVAYVYHEAPLICDDMLILDGCNEWMVKINNYIEFPLSACELIYKKKKYRYDVHCNCDLLINRDDL